MPTILFDISRRVNSWLDGDCVVPVIRQTAPLEPAQPRHFPRVAAVSAVPPLTAAALGYEATVAKYTAWQAAAFGIGANVVARALAGSAGAYENEPRAWFAPPGWVFPVAWSVNNAATLWGNLKVLNAEPSSDRDAYLNVQAAMWVLYLTFGFVYFRLRNRLAGYVVTANFLALTAASLPRALRIDRTLWRSYATLLPWLALATVVAHWQTTHDNERLDPAVETASATQIEETS